MSENFCLFPEKICLARWLKGKSKLQEELNFLAYLDVCLAVLCELANKLCDQADLLQESQLHFRCYLDTAQST